MSTAPSSDRVAAVRAKLAGYPDGTTEAVLDLLDTGSERALDQVVLGILAYHVPTRPGEPKPDLVALPGSTRLQEDLHVDSLAFAELGFLVEDVLGIRLTEEDLQGLRTIDDFRACLRRATARA